MYKKFLLAFVVLFGTLNFFVPNVKAAGTWYDPTYNEWSTRVFDTSNETEIFGERYTYAQVKWIIYSLTAVFSSPEMMACTEPIRTSTVELDGDGFEDFADCIKGVYPEESLIDTASIGAPNLASISSFKSYSQNIANTFTLVPETYAQGVGYTDISPIQTIWATMRGISYSLIIFGVVILAFAVMFRVKISPQAVIGIQTALPKIFITVLAITFSYAIVGLLIDLTYLIFGFFAMVFKSNNLTTHTDIGLFYGLLNNSFIGLFTFLAVTALLLILVLIFAAVGGLASHLPLIGGLLGGIAQVVWVVALVIAVSILVVTVIMFIRIAWITWKAFVTVILLTCFAPLILLTGMMPSDEMGFKGWIQSIVANLMVFPVISVMLLMSHYFFWSFQGEQSIFVKLTDPNLQVGSVYVGQYLKNWMNPFYIPVTSAIGTETSIEFPGIGNVVGIDNASTIGWITAWVILLLTPQAANIIKSLFERKPFGYGPAVTAGAGAMLAPATAVARRSWEMVSGGYEKAWQNRIIERINRRT